MEFMFTITYIIKSQRETPPCSHIIAETVIVVTWHPHDGEHKLEFAKASTILSKGQKETPHSRTLKLV